MRIQSVLTSIVIIVSLVACGENRAKRSSAQPVSHKLSECPVTGTKEYSREGLTRKIETSIEDHNYVFTEDNSKLIVNGRAQYPSFGNGLGYVGGCQQGAIVMKVLQGNRVFGTFKYEFSHAGQMKVTTTSYSKQVRSEIEIWEPK